MAQLICHMNLLEVNLHGVEWREVPARAGVKETRAAPHIQEALAFHGPRTLGCEMARP